MTVEIIANGDTGRYTVTGALSSTIHLHTFKFHGVGGKAIGTLHLSDPMTFDGNVDASAEVFLKTICQKYNELEADAKRYRWLRSSDTSTGTLAELARTAHSEDRFDAAIDAAIARNKT